MLSYQHAYHAGNFADVLKHLVLIELLDHLCKKDKAFSYIDTHAGSGLYNLASDKSLKTAEFQQGIGKIHNLTWPELNRYQQLLRAFNTSDNTQQPILCYPGSPLLALSIMRAQDRASLFELHPQEATVLRKHVATDKRVNVIEESGYDGLLSKLPPASRRGLILIDPSYELKNDYDKVVDSLIKAQRKFATGVYALWYPVVERSRIDALEKRLVDSGIRNIQRFELGIAPDSDGHGMTSAGMIVINPSWGLCEKMEGLLPKLAGVLGDGAGNYKVDVLVNE